VRFWDFAATPEGGDYTVGAMMIEDDISGFTYIADIKRGRFSPAQNEQLVRETASQDGTDTTIVIEQEPGSSGKAVVDSYARRILKGYIIRSMRPTGDKFVRAQPFFAAVDNNLVRMKDAGWNSDFIDELRLFPDGPHDDQVDSAAGGFNELNAVRYKGVVWGREGSSYSGVKPSGDLITGITWGRG
jgi:predicted phage terminase large subunit-like protein